MRELILITGEIDAGKTHTLIQRFEAKPRGTACGFATVKRFSTQEDAFVGYDLKTLATGEDMPFILLREKYKDDFSEPVFFERFVFAQAGFRLAEEIVSMGIRNRSIRDIFIDEVGQLELQGEGFSVALREALDSEKNITLALHKKNVAAMVKKFNIIRYKIIDCDDLPKTSGVHAST
ncbi:MAG: hypothetical protein E4G74_01425 [Erysipelotrichales bacterium]|nr:MAG: hypothetical protein E4G74_01425 [Erysipelotrichales bacterium]